MHEMRCKYVVMGIQRYSALRHVILSQVAFPSLTTPAKSPAALLTHTIRPLQVRKNNANVYQSSGFNLPRAEGIT